VTECRPYIEHQASVSGDLSNTLDCAGHEWVVGIYVELSVSAQYESKRWRKKGRSSVQRVCCPEDFGMITK